jgi:hypothetical protein
MDLLQSTAVNVPVPLDKYQARGSIILADAGAAGFQYKIVDQEGNVTAGAGNVVVNTPVAGLTEIQLLAADFKERGTMSIVLQDVAAVTIAVGQIDSGWAVDAFGVSAALTDSTLARFGLSGTQGGESSIVAVTIGSTANLGPYSLSVVDHAGNTLGTVYGRIVTTLSGGLDAAGVRAAVGLASANLDTQIGGILTAIATRAAPGAAMTLTSGERDAVANALLDLASAVETGMTPRQALRLLGSALGGVIVNTAPGVWQFRGGGVATTRITASIPGDGSRPSMVLTL